MTRAAGAAPAGGLSGYDALFQSLRARRRPTRAPRGLDALHAGLALALRQRRWRLSALLHEARRVDALAPAVRGLGEADLDEALRASRDAFVRGRQDDETTRRALALVREAARRQTGEEAYVVQLAGALGLVHGRVVQMLTGEGKTLAGSLAAPLIAWRRRRLHVFTVNDYLARRDATSREGLYRRCGLSVGAITQEVEPAARFELYQRPILYGTPKQITADWLRDQVRLGATDSPWAGVRRGPSGSALGAGGAGPMVPGLHAALIDEADAVLIDEGVVPLIIAQPRRGDDMADVYRRAAALGQALTERRDYRVDPRRRRVDLTPAGRERLRALLAEPGPGAADAIWTARRRAEELVAQALAAARCYAPGRQYQVVDGRVVIVDEYTGRLLPDRSWEHGLHQAVEAREGLDITADRETLARLSFQKFFRSYPFLCGMTGTAADARREIERVYARPVTLLPTHRPVRRVDRPARVFGTSRARWEAVADAVAHEHGRGRPVLVGTRSVEASERVSGLLASRGLAHRVLSATHEREEAQIVAQAGRAGAITVATNMAGRGTDIRPDPAALDAGGLHVILSEPHGARRVDRQFVGRSGRQGDPGSSQLFASMEDDLVRLHAPESRAWRWPAGELTGVTRRAALLVLGRAQRVSEARDRRTRAGVLRQDDWVDRFVPGR